MAYRPPTRNLWGLFVLWFLCERSMHPYEMQRLIRLRHKDEVLPLRPSSLYHAIEQLEKLGLIAAAETTREGRRPERTVYRVTEEGRDEATTWLLALVAEPQAESSQFLAAISQIAAIHPQQAASVLRQRAAHLRAAVAGMEAMQQAVSPTLMRVLLLESEYAITMLHAELVWVEAVAADIEDGRFSWSHEELQETARRYEGSPGFGGEP